jgi:signal transduction histidine kinase
VGRRLLPGGLRAQLALAIALVAILAVTASFIALYSGTSARLQAQIDSTLRTQLAEWRQVAGRSQLSTPATLRRAAQQFIAGQRYHAESLVIVIQPVKGAPLSNYPEVLAAEEAREHSQREPSGLLNSPVGLATVPVAEAGNMRVLASPIDHGGRRLGTLRVANPLTPVQQAQASLRRAFVVVGLIVLLLATVAGVALASLIAAPLRRMARVATAAGGGDLAVRAGPITSRGEIAMLASAFDDMLERLQRAFSRQQDFVSDASHELRTPLSVLRAQVELLDRETDEHRRHEGTTTLLRRLDQLDRLVADMLTLASAEAGQLVEPRTIELGEFFEDLRRDLPLFGERDYKLQPIEGTLQADPDRLTQVLRNLIRNAIAHTQQGDRVTIAAHAHDALLEITVSDNGPGIPQDQLEQIFERFHRTDAGRSRDTGGSGLGLPIARAIVEAHGGKIQAKSPPGRGATFRLSLPGYQPAEQPVALTTH